MKKAEKFSKFNQTELRIYEMMGIKLFRSAILFFEQFKHRKDGSQNINYHPRNTSVSALKSFSGYLLYNTMFHVVSLLLAVVYFVITRGMGLENWAADILIYLLVVFDLYCMMLQRYIYLKIKSRTARVLGKQEQQIRLWVEKLMPLLEKKEEKELAEEYELIRRIAYSVTTGRDCVLQESTAAILDRLAAMVTGLGIVKPAKMRSVANEITLGQALDASKNKLRLYGRIECRVSRLQRFLRVSKARNVLFGYGIVTESPDSEEAYRRLFPVDTRDGIELILTVLLGAYQQKGTVKDR